MKFSSALALSLALALASTEARAQLATPIRVGGNMYAVDATRPLGIPDCRNGTVSLQVSYTSTSTFNQLEFWMGTDAMTCMQTTSRTSTTAATCWQITTATVGGQQSTYANNDFRIAAKDLIDPIDGNCTTPATARGTIATNYLSLLAVTSAGANMQGMALAIPYDLDPPAAATGVTGLAGEGTVTVNWDRRTTTTTTSTDTDASTTSTTTATTDLAGFYLLCDPPLDSEGDAGSGADASTGLDVPDQNFGDDAGTSSTCNAFPTVDLYDTAAFNRYRRTDRTSASATTATATGLRDNTPYRCVVVAEDNSGNRSVSSPTQCIVPVPVTDFWERYRQAGGGAQPISCAAHPGAPISRTAGLAAALVVALASLIRRRRRTS